MMAYPVADSWRADSLSIQKITDSQGNLTNF